MFIFVPLGYKNEHFTLDYTLLGIKLKMEPLPDKV